MFRLIKINNNYIYHKILSNKTNKCKIILKSNQKIKIVFKIKNFINNCNKRQGFLIEDSKELKAKSNNIK
jgi:hypothetical protein